MAIMADWAVESIPRSSRCDARGSAVLAIVERQSLRRNRWSTNMVILNAIQLDIQLDINRKNQ